MGGAGRRAFGVRPRVRRAKTRRRRQPSRRGVLFRERRASSRENHRRVRRQIHLSSVGARRKRTLVHVSRPPRRATPRRAARHGRVLPRPRRAAPTAAAVERAADARRRDRRVRRPRSNDRRRPAERARAADAAAVGAESTDTDGIAGRSGAAGVLGRDARARTADRELRAMRTQRSRGRGQGERRGELLRGDTHVWTERVLLRRRVQRYVSPLRELLGGVGVREISVDDAMRGRGARARCK